ncbi:MULTISPECIES: OadG family protein [unclassified Luteococcus]|uniref:OadG family protein n=1 Tax=unclassified Luteococcus TaxID=2639923 RepID=UPI00313C3DCB
MNNLGWGLEMTLVGMGVVFALLAMLMGVLTLIGRLDRPDAPKAVEPDPAPAAQSGSTAAEPVEAPPATMAEPSDTTVAEPATSTLAEPVEVPASSVEILTDGLTVDQATAVALAVITHAEVRRQQAAPAMRTHAPGSQIHTSRWVAVGRGQQNMSWNRR